MNQLPVALLFDLGRNLALDDSEARFAHVFLQLADDFLVEAAQEFVADHKSDVAAQVVQETGCLQRDLGAAHDQGLAGGLLDVEDVV